MILFCWRVFVMQLSLRVSYDTVVSGRMSGRVSCDTAVSGRVSSDTAVSGRVSHDAVVFESVL